MSIYTHHRKFVLAAAAGAALILAGCTSADTEDTTSEAPATSAAPESSDTATDSMEMADFSSVHVALVPGGAHPYFQPWIAAGDDAKADFGLGDMVYNETAEWDQTKQNDVLNSLAASGTNAFGIFGVSPTDINTTFKTLKDAGYAVGSLASCPAGDVNEADFCLSTDTEEAAYKAAKAAIDAIGGEGTIAHMTGNNVDSNTQRRIVGVEKAVAETNGAVTLLPAITDVDVDLTTAQKAAADLLAASGSDLDAIVTTAYNPAVASASAIADSGLDIKLVAIDDDPTILAGIADGSVYGTIAQNPVGQAYVGSWVLAELSTGNCTMVTPGVIVDSGSFIVIKDNVETYDDERQAKSTVIMEEFKSNLLSC
ncbi:substrate-binding domain-containing protein [Demequina oxidasica]|uniref:substrate-binding domain-containing protein n=1 Tax=Demequina oxidasica TaxID=676199 RepID=UPI0009FE05AD|nr:substrate-binding domain-containing protein [Demequina oxidasica]